MVRFTVITAFPDFFSSFLSTGIVGRGVKAGLADINILDLRSFGKGAYRQIDDYAFGSGGMVLMAEPLEEALNTVRAKQEEQKDKTFVVYPTPQGVLLTQEIVESLFHQSHVIIVCGRYEGIDERFVEREVDLEVTIGDCVLTGGEIPAMAVIDAVARLIPGVVGKEEAVVEDSFYRGMLDNPHYTRPASWNGMNVPDVLLSGKSAEILSWRRQQAVQRTLSRRPELFAGSSLRGYMRGGFYLSFEYNAHEHVTGVEELALLCKCYGAARLLFTVQSPKNREILRQVIRAGEFAGREKLKLMPSFKRVLEWVQEKEKAANLLTVIDVCDKPCEGGRHWLEIKRFIFESGGPVVFRFSTTEAETAESEESEESESIACQVLPMLPIETEIGTENSKLSLSLLGKFAVILDRFLGS